MKYVYYIGSLALLLAAAAWWMSRSEPDHTDYRRMVAAMRSQKDMRFKQAPDSPLPDSMRRNFQGLSYFPIDPSWRVMAQFIEKSPNARIDTIGRNLAYAGNLRFELQGVKYSLRAYRHPDDSPLNLFVAFRDATSGKQTYGGGRYLDLSPDPSGLYPIDFNLAYHPYCVYNPRYICPVPPPDNVFPIAITAGEKLP
ncbi:MAG: DUF1684 domain-containing protein [Bacteroidia bacterium]|nr:DUF1684 domain-containing protein [Bacteroidia bacterium]MDW8333501.1 DUF1684 domain-containing protein [Bacteroidia bacterium]